jgi:hypothetical protein
MELKEKELYCTVGRIRTGRNYGPVERQIKSDNDDVSTGQ